jgi:WD40 repeat protein
MLLVVRGTRPKIETQGPAGIRRLQAWDTQTWQARTQWEYSWGTSRHALSPDGRYCAVGGVEGPVWLWSFKHGSKPDKTVLAFPRRVRGVDFSPDGRLLAASSSEGYVKIWELSTLTEREFRAHTSAREDMIAAHEVSFSADSRRVLTSGEDQEAIRLLDVATGREVISLFCHGEIRELFLSGDGHRLTARTALGDVLSWWVPSFEEIAQREYQRSRLK